MSTKVTIKDSQQGASLVEVVLAGGIFALVITTLVGGYLAGEESTVLAGARERASHLADAGIEAVRAIRDADFGNLTDGVYGLDSSSGEWFFSGTEDTTDIFTRQIEISTVDANTRQIVSSVTWQQNPQRTGDISVTTYLTNWRRTTAPGIGDWSLPSQGAVLDFPGNQDGLKVEIIGEYAYVIRSSSTPGLYILDISDTTNPTVVGSANLSGTPTNLVAQGAYAYISTTDNSAELQIVDISSPTTPAVIGSFDANDTNDALSIDISGSMVSLARSSGKGDELVVVDVTTPATPALVSSLNNNDDFTDLHILGSQLYLSSSSNGQEMVIVDITMPASPSVITTYNASGRDDGTAVIGFGSTVILGRVGGEVLVFDVAAPSSPAVVGTFGAGGTVNDLAIGNSDKYLFLATTEAASEFQVVDITIPSTPTLLGWYDAAGVLTGVAYSGTHDRAAVTGVSTSAEFEIIKPQ